jgi:hypothetical protein
VHLWGRQQIPPTTLEDNRSRDVWDPIGPDYWNEYRLKEAAAKATERNAPHTEGEDLPSRLEGRYWELKADLKEINQRWPNPQPPSPSRPRFTGPGSWMGR